MLTSNVQARLPLLVHPQDDPLRASVQVGPLSPVSGPSLSPCRSCIGPPTLPHRCNCVVAALVASPVTNLTTRGPGVVSPCTRLSRRSTCPQRCFRHYFCHSIRSTSCSRSTTHRSLRSAATTASTSRAAGPSSITCTTRTSIVRLRLAARRHWTACTRYRWHLTQHAPCLLSAHAGNYGTTMVPLDKLFGTYEDGSKWEKKSSKA